MHEYIITEFPADDEYWLLSWVGPVSVYENDYRIDIDLVAIDFEKYKVNPTILTYLKKEKNYLKGVLHPTNNSLLGFIMQQTMILLFLI